MTQAAWARAVVLEDWDVATELTSLLERRFPEASPSLRQFSAATTHLEKRFVSALILLRFPGWHPFVGAGPPRMKPANRLHPLRFNWWCGSDKGLYFLYDHYRVWLDRSRTRSRVSLLFESTEPDFPDDSQRQEGRQQWRQVLQAGTASNLLARRVLDQVALDSADPRLAEALHLVVKATRYGCPDVLTSEYSRQAYQRLHRLFPNSRWARMTPYWY